MSGALRSELFRLRRRRMPWVLLAILAAVIVLLYFLLWLSLEGMQSIATADGGADEIRELLTIREVAHGSGLGLVYVVAGVMAVIMGASSIATEYSWGTIRTMLPRTHGRGSFLGAKLLVLAGFALAVSAVGLLSALAASAAVTALAGLDGSLGVDFIPRVIASIALSFVILLPYTSIAFAVALLTRSTAAGVGVGLALFFLEGQFIQLLRAAGGVMETVTNVLLTPNISAVITLLGSDPESLATLLRAFAVIAVWTGGFAAFAIWRFQRRDVTLN